MKKFNILILSVLAICLVSFTSYFFVKKFIYDEAVKTLESFHIEIKKIDQNSEFNFQNIDVDIFDRIISVQNIKLKIPTNDVNINIESINFSGDDKKINFANLKQIEWIQKFKTQEYKIELSNLKFTGLDLVALYDFQKTIEWSNKDDIKSSIKKISLDNLTINNFKIFKKNVGKISQIQTLETYNLKEGVLNLLKINNFKLEENDTKVELFSGDFEYLNIISFYDIRKKIEWFNKIDVIETIRKISFKNLNLKDFRIHNKNIKNSFQLNNLQAKDFNKGKWGVLEVSNIKLNLEDITLKLINGNLTDLDIITLYNLAREIILSNKNVSKLIKKVSLKKINFTGLDIKTNSSDKNESLTVSTLSAKNIKDGNFGFFKVNNIKFNGNDVKLNLGSSYFTDLDIIALSDFKTEKNWSDKENIIEFIKKISLKNLNFQNFGIKTGNDISEENIFTIESLSSENFKDGVLGMFEVGNVQFNDFKRNRFNIKNIILKNFDFGQISQEYDAYSQKNLNETILIISEIYLSFQDRKDENFEFSINKINLKNIINNSGKIINSSNFSIENLTIPISNTKNSSLHSKLNKNSFNIVKILNKMNQKSFKINLQLGTSLDIISGKIKIDPLSVEVKGLGKFDLIIKLSELNSDVLRSLQDGDFENYNKKNTINGINKLGGKIAELKVLYEDVSFANEIFRHISNNNIKSLAEKWSKKILTFPFNDKFLLQSLSEATYNFILKGNKISLYSRPEQPFPIENVLSSFQDGTLSREMNIIIHGE